MAKRRRVTNKSIGYKTPLVSLFQSARMHAAYEGSGIHKRKGTADPDKLEHDFSRFAQTNSLGSYGPEVQKKVKDRYETTWWRATAKGFGAVTDQSNPLPPRDADTMSEAIALSSPDGHMSKRARETAVKRHTEALFGPGGLAHPRGPDIPEAVALRRRAQELRDLAARGMSPRKYVKQAERWEAEADRLQNPRAENPMSRPEAESQLTLDYEGRIQKLEADVDAYNRKKPFARAKDSKEQKDRLNTLRALRQILSGHGEEYAAAYDWDSRVLRMMGVSNEDYESHMASLRNKFLRKAQNGSQNPGLTDQSNPGSILERAINDAAVASAMEATSKGFKDGFNGWWLTYKVVHPAARQLSPEEVMQVRAAWNDAQWGASGVRNNPGGNGRPVIVMPSLRKRGIWWIAQQGFPVDQWTRKTKGGAIAAGLKMAKELGVGVIVEHEDGRREELAKNNPSDYSNRVDALASQLWKKGKTVPREKDNPPTKTLAITRRLLDELDMDDRSLLRDAYGNQNVLQGDRFMIYPTYGTADSVTIMNWWQPGSRKGNPEGESASMFETFHGSPSTEEISVTESVHEHGNLWACGKLRELVVHTVTGLKLEMCWDPESDLLKTPLLSSNEEGNQLYIRGGDQHITLAKIKMDTDEWRKDKMMIGEVHLVTYRTQKSFDKFKDIDYFHKLGEKTKKRPYLVYDPISKLMEFVGGQYRIDKPLFGVSDGIIN